MLRSIKSLHGYAIHAADGDMGKVYDFYFDDQTWTIRYLVADTGAWLSGRRVLLSTVSLKEPEWERREFPVSLTMEQVERSPNIDTHRPVSRQMEEDLYSYYGWSPYWGVSAYFTAAPLDPTLTMPQIETVQNLSERQEGDPHLRSAKEVIGYRAHASDGEVGHVQDFIADDENWIIRYGVVNTGHWLQERHVLIAPQWIQEVSWAGREVHVDLTCKIIENAPGFDPSAPVTREYEMRLHEYYDQPKQRG
jgi:hypothetical protein